MSRSIEYNASLSEFMSDYYQIEGTSRKDPALEIAMAYIESCMVTEDATGDDLKAEAQKLISQIDYLR